MVTVHTSVTESCQSPSCLEGQAVQLAGASILGGAVTEEEGADRDCREVRAYADIQFPTGVVIKLCVTCVSTLVCVAILYTRCWQR